MKFSTTLVATFASLSVAAPAHKRQTDDSTTSTSISDVLPGLTGEEPTEDTTVSDALAAANPSEIFALPPTGTFPIEENDFTGIQGVQSIEDSDDLVDAAISNLSGAAPPVPLTTGTPTADDVLSTLDFANEEDDDTDIEDLDVDIPPIPLSTGTATIFEDDGVLTEDEVTVGDVEAQAMIDAAIRYAQQLPDVAVPLSTGTPEVEVLVDPYLGNSTTSTLDSEDSTAAAATATTVDGTNLMESLQALNDALVAYQGSSSAATTGTDIPSTVITTDGTDVDATTSDATTMDATTDATLMERKIKMLGDDMLAGIQAIQKRAEMAEQENKKMKKKMKKVLSQRAGGVFANKTTSRTVMDKMGKGVLERYVNMVGGGN